ncbi:MAG: hypothetical protein KGL39_37920 [Patescibacteria group bacterium]|nr:hypothetical protein [Patescibacteria group bacterium]
MLIDINNAYNHVGSLILANDSKWQYDDSNYTDFPIATSALVSGQQDYALSSSHLTIDRVEVLDQNNKWWVLTQIDQQTLKRGRLISLEQYRNVQGRPLEYDLEASSLFLYPIPNYSQDASLKIFFSRPPSLFTTTDVSTGTKQPGFNVLFHDLIPLWVAYNYAVENGLPSASGFLAAINLKEQRLKDFYGLRNRDMRQGFTVSTNNSVMGSVSGQLNARGSDSSR